MVVSVPSKAGFAWARNVKRTGIQTLAQTGQIGVIGHTMFGDGRDLAV